MIITSLTQHVLNRHAARALGILDACWRGLAAQGDVPLWSRVDPADIQDALDHAFLAERYGHSHARIRVAGGSVAEMTGGDCAGLPLSLMFRPEDRPAFNEALRTACDSRCPIELDLSMVKQDVAARMVLYPLRAESGRITQLLGGLAPIGETVAARCRFGLVAIRATTPPVMAPARRSHLRLVVNNA